MYDLQCNGFEVCTLSGGSQSCRLANGASKGSLEFQADEICHYYDLITNCDVGVFDRVTGACNPVPGQSAGTYGGNKYIHLLTAAGNNILRFEFEDYLSNTRYAQYSSFNVDSASTNYLMTVSGYTGTAGDSMSYHNNAPFSAKDVDHDTNSGNCAVDYLTAWWNLSCLRIKLTATYASSGYNVMGWHGWESYKPLKVIMDRNDGSVDFYKTYSEYENGFGNKYIHLLTAAGNNILRFEFEDYLSNTRYAQYSSFNVDSASTNYLMTVSGYTGTAGDSMSYHNNAPFSAKDVDHDTNSGNCAVDYLTAWWNLSCLRIKLTATYASSGYNVMGWHGWESYKPLKVARMLIRH
uniref:Ficolin-1 n=1 Tax=Magallana gigas TaxID=29159 RepID=K1QR97_MAGGI